MPKAIHRIPASSFPLKAHKSRVRGRRSGGYRISLGGLLAIGFLLACGDLRAASETWTGTAGSNWNSAGNWTGTNLPPLAGDTLLFGTSAVTGPTNDYTAGTSFGG